MGSSAISSTPDVEKISGCKTLQGDFRLIPGFLRKCGLGVILTVSRDERTVDVIGDIALYGMFRMTASPSLFASELERRDLEASVCVNSRINPRALGQIKRRCWYVPDGVRYDFIVVPIPTVAVRTARRVLSSSFKNADLQAGKFHGWMQEMVDLVLINGHTCVFYPECRLFSVPDLGRI